MSATSNNGIPMALAESQHFVHFTHDQPRHIPLVMKALLLFLAAVTIFGKGPTYLFYPPLYWGEVTLVLMLAWMGINILQNGFPPRLLNPCALLILIFMLMGMIIAFPDFINPKHPGFRMLVLRDSAIWYYALFFFVGLYITTISHVANWLWQHLITVWGLALLWSLAMRSFNRAGLDFLLAKTAFLNLPWTPGHVLSGSSSENMQHMALGALLLGMGVLWQRTGAYGYVVMIVVSLWSFKILFSSHGRGAKIAVLGAITVLVLATIGARRTIFPATRWFVAGYLVFLALAVFAVAAGAQGVSTLVLKEGRLERFQTMTENIKGTAQWRQEWWKTIYDEVMESSPMTGLGFGTGLGDYNRYIKRYTKPGKESDIRSPHNINITVFARMGIGGTIIWLFILLLGIGRLFWRIRDGTVNGLPYTESRYKELAFWLAMLVVTWVNASFGVLMEGPVLGIWFWFALGFAWGRASGADATEARMMS